MQYCNNCGNELNGEKFCIKCGAPAPADIEVTGGEPVTGDSKKGIIGMAVAAVAVIAIIIGVFASCSGGGYKGVVKKYVKAVMQADGEKLIELYPEYYVEDRLDGWFDSKKNWAKSLDSSLESRLEEWEDDDFDIKHYSYELRKDEKLDKDDIEDIEDAIDDYYDEEVKVKDARKIKIRIEAKQDGKKKKLDDYTITLIKTGGSWSIYY